MKQLTLVFLRRDNRVLLAMKKRGFGANKWNGVGGKADIGETIEQAMIRECQEEINVTPTKYAVAGNILFHEFDDGTAKDMAVRVYTCTEWTGEPTESEEMAPQWFEIESIPYDDMWSDDPYWLPLVLNGNVVEAEFCLDAEDSVTKHRVSIL